MLWIIEAGLYGQCFYALPLLRGQANQVFFGSNQQRALGFVAQLSQIVRTINMVVVETTRTLDDGASGSEGVEGTVVE